MTGTATSLAQFKACLANDSARRRIGLDISDAEALRILADDGLTEQWHRWWQQRPANALATARVSSPPANPALSPVRLSTPAAAPMGPVSIENGVLGVCAAPAGFVFAVLASLFSYLLLNSQGLDAANGLRGFGYVIGVILSIAGILLSSLTLKDGLRAPATKPRRATAVVLGSVGLGVSVLGTLALLFPTVFFFSALQAQ